MQLRRGKPMASVIDAIGATCAYAIIISMLATAIAPLFAPLLQH